MSHFNFCSKDLTGCVFYVVILWDKISYTFLFSVYNLECFFFLCWIAIYAQFSKMVPILHKFAILWRQSWMFYWCCLVIILYIFLSDDYRVMVVAKSLERNVWQLSTFLYLKGIEWLHNHFKEDENRTSHKFFSFFFVFLLYKKNKWNLTSNIECVGLFLQRIFIFAEKFHSFIHFW